VKPLRGAPTSSFNLAYISETDEIGNESTVCDARIKKEKWKQTMKNYEIERPDRTTPGKRTLFVTALALGCAFATVAPAQGQYLTAPTTPSLITPPAGNSVFLVGHAQGTQGYICLPTSAGASTASWTKNGRPEATLFVQVFGQEFQIITHFLSPDTNPNEAAPKPIPFGSATWQSSLDSSKVWAQVFNGTSIPAGSDPTSCPNAGSIACLLLQSIGSQQGPSGGATLSKTTFVQRLNTNGGSAPLEGCSTATDVGNQTLVPYTADYYFYRADK
jgi:hypothetical protein